MKRGVVTLPIGVHKHDGGFVTHSGLTPLELNFFSLYWDELSVPQSSFISTVFKNEKDYIDCGVLTRPLVTHGNSMDSERFPQFLLESQFTLVDYLRDRFREDSWCIHQRGEAPLFSRDEIIKDTVSLELRNLLPVPGEGVHIHDILEFKDRRKTELETLHAYSEELYFEIIKSADPRIQYSKTYGKLKEAIEDIQKLNGEVWRSPIRFDLNISPEFDLSQARAGIATIVSAITSPHPVETLLAGSIVGVLEGFIKIKPSFQSIRAGENENLIYLTNAEKEGLYK